MTESDYEKLKLDALKKMAEGRDITCKQTKEEIIKHLLLDDAGKYVRQTTIEKHGKDSFMVGVCLRNRKLQVEMGRLVEKKEATRLAMFANQRVYFITKRKPIE